MPKGEEGMIREKKVEVQPAEVRLCPSFCPRLPLTVLHSRSPSSRESSQESADIIILN